MRPAPAPPRRAGRPRFDRPRSDRPPPDPLRSDRLCPAWSVARFLLATGLSGLLGCAAAEVSEIGTDASEAVAAADSGAASPAPGAATEALPSTEPAEAKYFGLGQDGRLHPRLFELPPSAVTRAEAEAVVRRVVADSGTFPPGVEVLDVFVSGRGVAVVNFTNALLLGHSGGLLAEELTVYSLSHSLVENFPAIAEVRFVVEGQEADTLAGHLDLRSGFGRAPARLLADSGGEPR